MCCIADLQSAPSRRFQSVGTCDGLQTAIRQYGRVLRHAFETPSLNGDRPGSELNVK